MYYKLFAMIRTSPYQYPAQVFFDGNCPLCRREAHYFRDRDVDQQLRFINIAAPDFDAAEYQLPPERVHDVMHVRMADGKIYTELNAFSVIWSAMPKSNLFRLLPILFALPGIRYLGGVCYRLFAANRYRLTGRCRNGVCHIRKNDPSFHHFRMKKIKFL